MSEKLEKLEKAEKAESVAKLETTFDKYFGKDLKEINEENKGRALRKVERGFGSAIDQLEEMRYETENEIQALRVRIVQGKTEKIRDLGVALVKIKDINSNLDVLKNESITFIGKKED